MTLFPKTKRAVADAKSTIQLGTVIAVAALIVSAVALLITCMR